MNSIRALHRREGAESPAWHSPAVLVLLLQGQHPPGMQPFLLLLLLASFWTLPLFLSSWEVPEVNGSARSMLFQLCLGTNG